MGFPQKVFYGVFKLFVEKRTKRHKKSSFFY
jgi:hypothetical protein